MARQRRFHSRKGPACSVCIHRDRARIEASRIAGVSLTNLAKKFGVGRDAIHRHMHAHVSEDERAMYLAEVPIKDLAEAAAAEGVSVIEYLSIVRTVLMTQFQMCAAAHDKNGVAILAGRLTEVLNSIGRITGEMGALASNHISITNNVAVLSEHPAFAKLQATMLRALAPFPDARAAVVTALRDLDSENASARPAMKVIDHVGA
jgi:hypothetical protein